MILQLLAEGYTVRTTVRSFNREASLRTALSTGGATDESLTRLSFCVADLENDAGWKEAVDGVDFVHHVASPFPVAIPKHEDELIIPAREGYVLLPSNNISRAKYLSFYSAPFEFSKQPTEQMSNV